MLIGADRIHVQKPNWYQLLTNVGLNKHRWFYGIDALECFMKRLEKRTKVGVVKPSRASNITSSILLCPLLILLGCYLYFLANLTSEYLGMPSIICNVFFIINLVFSVGYYFLIIVFHEKYSRGRVLKKEGIPYKVQIGLSGCCCIPRKEINKRLFIKMANQPFINIVTRLAA